MSNQEFEIVWRIMKKEEKKAVHTEKLIFTGCIKSCPKRKAKTDSLLL